MNKKLYRSRTDVIIGGVASGLAEYLAVDVSLVRLLWAFAGLMGPGVVAYLIAWVLVPQEPVVPDYLETEQVGDTWEAVGTNEAQEASASGDKQRTLAIILIGVGLVFLARRVIPGFFFSWTWPVVLIGFGIYILLQDKRRD